MGLFGMCVDEQLRAKACALLRKHTTVANHDMPLVTRMSNTNHIHDRRTSEGVRGCKGQVYKKNARQSPLLHNTLTTPLPSGGLDVFLELDLSHPQPVETVGHPLRQRHHSHRVAAHGLGVPDNQAALVAVLVVDKAHQVPVVLTVTQGSVLKPAQRGPP